MPNVPKGACVSCGGLGEQCICDRADELGIHNGGHARDRARRRRELRTDGGEDVKAPMCEIVEAYNLLLEVDTDPLDEDVATRVFEALEDLDNAILLNARTLVCDGGEDVPVDSEEPPEDVRWTDADHGVVELELTRPLLDWIELEVAEHDFDSVTDWIERQIRVTLQADLQRRHEVEREVEVDLPLEFVARLRHYQNDLALLGKPASFEDHAVNLVQLERTYLLDGEPLGSDRSEEAGDDE